MSTSRFHVTKNGCQSNTTPQFTASLSAQAVMQGAVSVASSKTVWVLELQCSLPHTHEDIKTLLTNLDVNGWKSKLLLVDTDEVHNIGQLVHGTQRGHGTGDSLNNAVTETENRKNIQCTEFIKSSRYCK